MQGMVIYWNNEKGFGFISENNTRKQHYFHISKLKEESDLPKYHSMVEYDSLEMEDGRFRAINVTVIEQGVNEYVENNNSEEHESVVRF